MKREERNTGLVAEKIFSIIVLKIFEMMDVHWRGAKLHRRQKTAKKRWRFSLGGVPHGGKN